MKTIKIIILSFMGYTLLVREFINMQDFELFYNKLGVCVTLLAIISIIEQYRKEK